jgi:tape measure domain-containing protein
MAQEVMDIFVSLGINMDNFNAGIQKINRQLKLVESEFQAAAARLSDFGKTSDSLRLQVDTLTQKIDLQRQKVAAYEQAIQKTQAEIEKHGQNLAKVKQRLDEARAQYEAVAASMGKNSDEAKALDEQVQKLEKEYKAKIQTLQSDDKALDNNRIKLNNARKELAQLENELHRATQELNGNVVGLKRAADAAQSTGSVFAHLGDMVKASLVFTGVYGGINAVADSFKRAAAAGIDFDAQMQQAQIGFTTLLGSAQEAQKMLQDLADFAQSTPFELTGVEEAAKQMLAMGFTAKEILPDMKAIGDAAAALGLQTDGIQRITLALGQLKTHGVVDAQDMLQLTEAGIPAWDILAKAIGKTVPELQKLVSQGVVPADKAVQALIQGMEQRFPNMLQKMNNSFVSQMGNLKDGLNRTLGEAMKPVFDWLTNTALPALNNRVNEFRQTLEQTGSLKEAFATIIPPEVVDTVSAVANGVKVIINLMIQLRPLLISVAAGWAAWKTASFILDGLVTVIPKVIAGIRSMTAAMTAFDAVMAANPLGAIATMLGVGAGAMLLFRQVSDTSLDDVRQHADATAKSIAQINDEIKQQTQDAQTNLSTLTNNINQLQQLKQRYEELSKTLATAKSGTDAYKQAQAQLIDIKRQLIDIVGKEAANQILSSKNVVKAFNDEIKAMLQAQLTELTAANNRLKAEQNLTNGIITETNKRIQAMQNEIDAFQKTQDIFATDNYLNGANADASLYAIDNYVNGVESAASRLNNDTTALADAQERLWQRMLPYQNWLRQNTKGPLDNAIAQTQAMLEALKKNNNAMFGTGSSSFSLLPSSSSGRSASASAKKAAQDLVQAFIDGIQSKLTPFKQTIDQLQAQLQFWKDSGNAKAVKQTTDQLIAAYKREMDAVQKAMASVNAEIKKLDPKKHAADIAKLKDEYSQLKVEWWQDRDAIVQLNNELKQQSIQAAQAAADAWKTASDAQLDAIQTALNNEMQAIQAAHQKALAEFDAQTQALEAAIDAQIAALQQAQTQDERANQQQQWDKQMADLQHQLAVANMMGDQRTVRQVQDQIDQLNQQISQQKADWARQDQIQALEQQKQQLEQQRALQRQALDQEWQDREAAFQRQMEQTLQHFQALQAALVQAIQDRKLTRDQAEAAWQKAIKDNGDKEVQLYIANQQKAQKELDKWVNKYVDIGKNYGKSLGQGLVDGLNASLSAVKAAAAQLADVAASAIGIGKTAIATATATIKVPKMATGGILTGPTLALAGEAGPEAVIPLNDSTMSRLASAIVAQMRSGGGQGQQPINIYIGDDLVASYVWDYGLQRIQERQRKG